MNEIDKLLLDYEPKHSAFQIENFIIGMQSTEWMQYKQCLREIKSRSDSLESYDDQLKLFNLNRLSLKHRIRLFFMRGVKKAIFEKNEVKKSRALQAEIRETKRELDTFVNIAVKLKEKLGDLNPEKRALLEADSWFQKAKTMAAIDMICGHGLSKPTFEMILALPEKDKNLILSELGSCKDPRKLLE